MICEFCEKEIVGEPIDWDTNNWLDKDCYNYIWSIVRTGKKVVKYKGTDLTPYLKSKD